MLATQVKRSDSLTGLAETPGGQSVVRDFRSLARRSVAARSIAGVDAAAVVADAVDAAVVAVAMVPAPPDAADDMMSGREPAGTATGSRHVRDAVS